MLCQAKRIVLTCTLNLTLNRTRATVDSHLQGKGCQWCLEQPRTVKFYSTGLKVKRQNWSYIYKPTLFTDLSGKASIETNYLWNRYWRYVCAGVISVCLLLVTCANVLEMINHCLFYSWTTCHLNRWGIFESMRHHCTQKEWIWTVGLRVTACDI